MKNNTLYLIIIAAFSFNIALPAAQEAVKDVSFIKRQYERFSRGVSAINKCYFQKSGICTDQERKEALWTIGGSALLLITAIYAMGIGYKGLQIFNLNKQNQAIKNDLWLLIPQAQTVEVQGDEVNITVSNLAAVEKQIDGKDQEIADIIKQHVPGARYLLIEKMPLWLKVLPGVETVGFPPADIGNAIMIPLD